jgi:hypothetical protein
MPTKIANPDLFRNAPPRCIVWPNLVQCFDIAHAPRLVESSGLRAVEAEHDEPVLAGLGLHPVRVVALG